MAQPIPPLLCNTPPPIDFDDGNDDDFGDFEGARTDYEGSQGSLSASPRHEVKGVEDNLELPPLPNDVEYSLYTDINPSPIFDPAGSIDFKELLENQNNNDGKVELSSEESQNDEILRDKCSSEVDLEDELNAIKLTETQVITINDTINRSELKTEHLEKSSREDSPQSLDLCTSNLSDDEDDSIGEFQVANEAKYDDNTSLPSLKFDSIIVSKSTTPIFDEKANESKEQVDTVGNDDSVLSALPSLTSSQTNLEDKLETNIPKADNDEFEVTQDKPEDSFTEFHQSHRKEDADESNMTIAASISSTNEEILNEKNEQTVMEDFKFSNFEDFTLNRDVVMETKAIICEAKEISRSPEEHTVDNFSSFTFEADFSQFESVDTNAASSFESEKILKTDKSITNTVDDDDFEDFQDFTTTKAQPALDEDFGEFSEFDTTNQSWERRDSFKLKNVDGKVKSILDLMFPEESKVDEASHDNLKNKAQQDTQSFINQITTNLQDIDSAMALDYQWTNSNVKHSLIKALGIDSRNILYGEKWNSSVPRFAANLVFNPLEPLRPVKVGGHSSTFSVSQETRHAETTAASKGNVPEVEFDWNSSGLVNPLDASHAHTLLLDLDQLVVVANLDKIKLDSSSPCSSATLETLDYINATTSTLKSSAKTNVPSNIRVPNHEWLEKHNNLMDNNNINEMHLNDCNNTHVSGVNYFDGNVLFGDGPICINRKICSSANIANSVNMIVANATAYTTNSHHGFDNDLRNDLFDRCLDFSVKEVVCERKTQAIHTPQSGSINESIEHQATEKAINNQINPSNTTTNLSSVNNDLINETFSMQDFTNGEEQVVHQITKLGSDETHSSTPTAFVFPLKETHIYTPSKLDSVSRHTKAEDKDPIDFDYKTAAAGIIIDEKVVKKEYRDVEYNPTNWNLGPLEEKYITSSNGLNMCTSNNFETPVDILSDSFPSLAEKNDDSKISRVMNFSQDFSSFQYNFTKNNSNLKEVEQNIRGDDRDNFEPIMQITEELSSAKNDSGLDDDFSEFQSVPPPVVNPIKVNNQMLKTTVEEKIKSRTGTPTLSDEMILSPAVLLPQAIKIESGPKIDWPQPGINPEELARIEELFPQSKSESKRGPMPESQAPKIATSVNDDDDWSDFVSVPATNQSSMSQMQTQLGSNNSTLKAITSQPNDEEWSDFVSSAPVQWNNPAMLPQYNVWNNPTTKSNINPHISSQPNLQHQHKNNVPTNFFQRNNVNNNISQYLLHSNSVIADHRPNHFLPPQQEQFPNFHNAAQYQNQIQQDQSTLKSQLNQTPSISLIPDLGFVAPRNLINIPRSAINKK